MNDARESSRRLAVLLRCEQGAMADFLVALAEFDRQRLWMQLGHASVFYYLHRDLKLSKGAAHYRKVAARLIQKFPEVVAPFREGKLCISSVVELARVITPENSAEVLPRFFHLSKQEAKAVAVEICPAAVVPRREVVTKVVTELPRAAPIHPGETPLTQFVQVAPQAVPMQSEPLTSNLQRLHMTFESAVRISSATPSEGPAEGAWLAAAAGWVRACHAYQATPGTAARTPRPTSRSPTRTRRASEAVSFGEGAVRAIPPAPRSKIQASNMIAGNPAASISTTTLSVHSGRRSPCITGS
jgi:hypothetical protein